MTTKPDDTEATTGLSGAKSRGSAWMRPLRDGGIAALVTGSVLLIGAISFAITLFQRAPVTGWVSLAQDNWLIVLVKLHAGFEGIQPDRLYGLYPLDLAILFFNGFVYLGLFVALRRTSRTWSFIALALAFLGILLLFVTKTAGRSSVMGAGLVISFVMLRSRVFSKITAGTGILASALLLVGDMSLSSNHSYPLAILTGVGYMLLAVWFFLIGRGLISSSHMPAQQV